MSLQRRVGSSTDLRMAVSSARVALIFVIGVLLPSAALSATVSAQVQPAPAVRPILSGVNDDADDRRWHMSRCLLGVSYGSPLKVYVSAAAGLRRAFDARTVCTYGAVHLGLGGVRTSLGTAVTLGRFGSALGVSAGVLRTFGNPAGNADARRSYVGGSVHVWPVFALHSEFGAYSRVARSGEGPQRIFVWSAGFGY